MDDRLEEILKKILKLRVEEASWRK